MTDFDPRPPTAAVLPAAAAAAATVLVLATGSTTAVAVAAPGAVGVVYGAHTGTRRFVTVGAAAGFAAAVLAAVQGLPVATALVAGVAALVAYDTGEHAVTLGVDVGTHAPVGQSVLVHATGSVVVATLAAGLGYVAYAVGPSNLPVTGLLALLLAAVLLAYALGD
ncbi:DUF7519 family protein [Halobacterium yunchengense]|uniref:DUF7519 family protein n=1 Tax=Halobacterium yunchengense TaxID=3108497 RepID=UPI00300B9DBC